MTVKSFEINNFTEAINNSSKLVVVCFFAPWCQPCKNMRPIFNSLPELLGTKNFVFGEVNIATSPTIAPSYGIKSVPSVAIFKQQNLLKIIPGELNQTDLAKTLKLLL